MRKYRLAAAMPLQKFWKIVDNLGWGTKTTDYKYLMRELMQILSPKEAAAFAERHKILKNQLYVRLNEWEEEWIEETGNYGENYYGVGDDGFSDLINHIIGTGKSEYQKVMNNPSLAKQRADKGDYAESFAYAIPSMRDYELLDLEHYISSIRAIISKLEGLIAFYETEEPSPEAVDYLNELIDLAEDAIAALQVADFDGFRSVMRELIEENDHGPLHYWPDNLLSDFEKFYLGTVR